MDIKLTSTQDAIVALERYLDVLYERAVAAADVHWDFVYETDSKMEWSKKSRLFLRCKRAGSGFALEWYEVRWVGSKAMGNRQQLRRYITKPKNGFSYSSTKLLALAREWESEKVMETEAIMAGFRRDVYGFTRALMALRNTAKAEEKR